MITPDVLGTGTDIAPPRCDLDSCSAVMVVL